MRFVTFNIHHGTVGSRGRVDPERLAATCAGFDADVLALQEVDVGTARVRGADLAAVVAEACGAAHVFGSSRRFLGGRYGNALVVRGEIVRSSVTRLARFPANRLLQERRTVLRADVVVGGTGVSVLATHLAVPPVVNGRQLDEVLRMARRAPDPTVVLGDLNRSAGMVAAEAPAAGLHAVEHGPTFPAKGPRRSIDHVLLGPGLRATAVEVRPTPMSDHAALLVDVDLEVVDPLGGAVQGRAPAGEGRARCIDDDG